MDIVGSHAARMCKDDPHTGETGENTVHHLVWYNKAGADGEPSLRLAHAMDLYEFERNPFAYLRLIRRIGEERPDKVLTCQCCK